MAWYEIAILLWPIIKDLMNMIITAEQAKERASLVLRLYGKGLSDAQCDDFAGTIVAAFEPKTRGILDELAKFTEFFRKLSEIFAAIQAILRSQTQTE